MQELKDVELREMSDKMSDNVKEKHYSDVEDGSFMMKIPHAISKTNLAEPDYMNEVRSIHTTWLNNWVY